MQKLQRQQNSERLRNPDRKPFFRIASAVLFAGAMGLAAKDVNAYIYPTESVSNNSVSSTKSNLRDAVGFGISVIGAGACTLLAIYLFRKIKSDLQDIRSKKGKGDHVSSE